MRMMQRTKKLLRQSVKVWAPDGHEGLANLSPKRIILLMHFSYKFVITESVPAWLRRAGTVGQGEWLDQRRITIGCLRDVAAQPDAWFSRPRRGSHDKRGIASGGILPNPFRIGDYARERT